MITSSAQTPKKPDPLSILLIGPPGGGKTTLMLQFPKVEVKDCDRNLDGPEQFLRTKLKDLAYIYDPVTYDEIDGVRKFYDIHECYDRLYAKLIESKKTDSLTLGTDSLSMVNEFIVRKVLGDQFRPTIEIRDWMKIKANYYDLLIARMRGINKTSICTCHEDIKRKPDSRNPILQEIVSYDPAVQGSTGDILPGLFSNVWRCVSIPGPAGRTDYKIYTSATALSPYLKNSLGLPSVIDVAHGELAFDKLKPYMNGKL